MPFGWARKLRDDRASDNNRRLLATDEELTSQKEVPKNKRYILLLHRMISNNNNNIIQAISCYLFYYNIAACMLQWLFLIKKVSVTRVLIVYRKKYSVSTTIFWGHPTLQSVTTV